jgi:hydrogenase/urease accessory protein HupE
MPGLKTRPTVCSVQFTQRLTFVVALLLWAAPALAHPMRLSYVDVDVTGDAVNVSVVMPAFDVAHDLGLSSEERVFDPGFVQKSGDALTRLVLSRLALMADGRTVPASPVAVSVLADLAEARVQLRYATRRPGELAVIALLFPYDPTHQTYLNIYENGHLTRQSILDAAQPGIRHYTGTTQGTLAVIRRFVAAGIEHIAIGPDHILFLVGLLLLGGSVWQLLKIVTAFTVAHSITLTVAALNLFSPSTRLVEPAIALSIIYVGIDNLLVKPGSRDTRVWIALTFGLIHGFGFARVLREMDLPRRALGWSLFSFNLGVEIGQIIIVVIVASILAWIAARSTVLRARIAYAGSVIVATAGLIWFVQRVFFVGGA